MNIESFGGLALQDVRLNENSHELDYGSITPTYIESGLGSLEKLANGELDSQTVQMVGITASVASGVEVIPVGLDPSPTVELSTLEDNNSTVELSDAEILEMVQTARRNDQLEKLAQMSMYKVMNQVTVPFLSPTEAGLAGVA